jgi:hypothetical protein
MRMYIEWLMVMYYEIGWTAFKGVLRGLLELRKHKVGKAEWFRRMRVCMKCPIYNARLRSCRTGSMGCGCYVPFSNLVKKECWGREKYGESFGWGWDDMKPAGIRKLNRLWNHGKKNQKQ